MDARRNLVDEPWTTALSLQRDEGSNASASTPEVAKVLDLDLLTAREREVVQRAVGGHSNKAIAYDLGIADATVRVLLWRAYGKLGVRSRRELVAKAFVLSQRAVPEQDVDQAAHG
jgi:DNA-binding NarL/FixJ family response regulator